MMDASFFGVFKMRALVLLFCVFVGSASAFVGVESNYHDVVGIPHAAELKAYEDAVIKRYQGEDRIVGGAVAPINAHPYLAGLVISLVGQAGVSACGASLLSANRLVTAAHCWFDGVQQAWQFEVVLGSSMLFYGGTRLQTSSVVLHQQWTPSLLWNDVAIIYLNTNVAFNEAIQPVALPSSADLFDTFAGQWAVAAGYGKTADSQLGVSVNTVVSHVDLLVISVAQCQATFGSVFVQSSNICTSGAGGVGICGGDSGGPLVVVRNGVPTLVGVSSFVANIGCQLGHPSAFARVTSFYNFILQHLW